MKTKLFCIQSFFFFYEKISPILLRAGKKITFLYKNLTISQLLYNEDQEELWKIFNLLSVIKILTLSPEFWSPAETNESQIQPMSPAFLTASPHGRRQCHFTPTFTNMRLRLPGLQADRWFFLTNSSKPVILVWMEPLQSAFFLNKIIFQGSLSLGAWGFYSFRY